MGAIYNWVKNIVVFYILMTAVLHLLPKSSYQKYVRFFSGLLLVVLLLTPLLEFLFKEDYLLNRISYESFWQQADTVKLDVSGMEEIQQNAYKREYERAIAGDMALLVQGEEITVESAAVTLGEDYTISSVDLTVRLTGQKEGILIEKITLGDNSRDYPQVVKIKEKLMDFYEVSDHQIQITVKEG